MIQLADKWLTGSVWIRITLWLALMMLMGICLWYLLLTPIWQQQMLLTDNLATLRQQQTQLQHKLQHLAASTPVTPAPVAPIALPVFSITDNTGLTLIHWLPHPPTAVTEPHPSVKQTSELTLAGDWQQLPALFDLLAQHQAMPVTFSLVPDNDHGSLKLTLLLETDDEN